MPYFFRHVRNFGEQNEKELTYIKKLFKNVECREEEEIVEYFKRLPNRSKNYLDIASKMLMGVKLIENTYESLEKIETSNAKFSDVYRIFTGDKCIMIHKYPNEMAKYEFEFKGEFIHEIFIGLVLNQLRSYVPNFVYTYGYFETDDDTYNPYAIMIENIDNSIPLEDIIKNLSGIEYFRILIQILNALNVASIHFDFCHQDLHDGNILIQKFETPIKIPLYLEGRTKYIRSKYLATIIDFGQSYVKIKNQSYGVDNRDELMNFLSKSKPINDIYKLLCFSGFTAQRSNNEEVYDLISRIYQFFDQKKTLKSRLKFFEDSMVEVETENGIVYNVTDGFNYNQFNFEKKNKKYYLTDEYKHSDLLNIIEQEIPEWKIL